MTTDAHAGRVRDILVRIQSLAQQGHVPAAAALRQEAVERYGDDPNFSLAVAVGCAGRGDLSTTASMIERILAEHPEHHHSRKMKADIHYMMGRFSEAEAAYSDVRSSREYRNDPSVT
ncbi:hypothetical protein [Azospirillum sp. ST 5-10]|uniref:hypothetical protein n=1 Tax=unclassified Azospirillum TaxID=2630922 RepID=UPI003F4A21B6